MEKLMKPAEYAKEIGISRQAVYAKIKRGILTSKSVEGKLYIVVDKTSQQQNENSSSITTPTKTTKPLDKNLQKDYKALLEAKDETISVLKGTVKELKKSNKEISKTLKGEIDLLKDAFHEMRSLYILQLEHKNRSFEEIIEIEEDSVDTKWIGLKKFFKAHKISKTKQQEKVLKRIKKAFKKDDIRIIKIENKLKLDVNADYGDIIK